LQGQHFLPSSRAEGDAVGAGSLLQTAILVYGDAAGAVRLVRAPVP